MVAIFETLAVLFKGDTANMYEKLHFMNLHNMVDVKVQLV